MATTENAYTNTTDATHSFTFPYLQKSDVKVSVRDDDGQVDELTKDATNGYTVQTTTITLTGTAASGLTTGDTVRIYRETAAALPATFYPGSAIRSSDLNDNFTQNLYTTQEVVERYLDSKGGLLDSTLTLGEDANLVFEGETSNDFETTLTVTDPTADRTITLPNETGTVVTTVSPNVIDSDHYVDGSIDLAHMSANSVDSDQYVDGSIDLAHMSANSVDSDQYVDGSIDLVHMSANSVDSDQYVDGSIDGVHIANDAIDSQHYAAGSIDNEHIADGAIDSAALSAATVITNSEQASATANDTSFLTSSASDARYFLQNSTETLKDGVSWVSSDAYIVTSAAIDDRVASLVNEVGGFVAFANEGSFPTTNPDIENNTGTIVSITALSADRTASGSGVLTTGFTTTGSVAVTITGCTNNQVYKQGYGLQVETTSTLNTYTFVRYVPQTSDVTAVAANVTNISTVAGIQANVTKVANIDSNVTTVAGIDSNVTTVAGIQANVTTVAGIQANVTTVAGISGNVTTVAGDTTAINNITTNLSAVQGAAGNATTATTKATEAASSASAAATSATSAAGAVTALNTLSYYHNLGSIADTAGTTSDYGAIA